MLVRNSTSSCYCRWHLYFKFHEGRRMAKTDLSWLPEVESCSTIEPLSSTGQINWCLCAAVSLSRIELFKCCLLSSRIYRYINQDTTQIQSLLAIDHKRTLYRLWDTHRASPFIKVDSDSACLTMDCASLFSRKELNLGWIVGTSGCRTSSKFFRAHPAFDFITVNAWDHCLA